MGAAAGASGRSTWTFDPLVRANARFNLVKLGAVAVAYLTDFYGEMQDGINAGDRSDRCAVKWELDDPGPRPPAPVHPSKARSPPSWCQRATVLLAVGPDDATGP